MGENKLDTLGDMPMKTSKELLEEIRQAFEIDWASLPRRDSDKKKGFISYKNSVGCNLKKKRPLFQAKVESYTKSVADREKRFIKSGTVFINQWEGLEIDEPKQNSQPKPANEDWKKQFEGDRIPAAEAQKFINDFTNKLK